MQTNNEVYVEVKKLFKLYLKRTNDVKTLSWFSLPFETLTGPDFFRLTPGELKFFLWIVSVAAKEKNPVVKVDVEHAAYNLKLSAEEFHSMCSKLEGKQTIVRPAGYVYVPEEDPEEITSGEGEEDAEKTSAAASRPPRGRNLASTGEERRGEDLTGEKKKKVPPAKSDWSESEQAAATASFLNEFGSDPEMAKALRIISPTVINMLVKKYARPWLDESLAQAILHQKSKQGKSDIAKLRDLDVRLLSWFKDEQKPQFRNPGSNEHGFFDKAEQQMATAGRVN